MADVQVTVGLRGKTGVDGHALVLAAGSQVLGDEIVNKVAALGALGLVSGDDFVFLAHIVLLLIVNYCKILYYYTDCIRKMQDFRSILAHFPRVYAGIGPHC